MSDYLTDPDWKLTGWLIKITFLGEDQTAMRSGVNSTFGIMGF